MKSYKNLYEQCISDDNFKKAKQVISLTDKITNKRRLAA